MKDPVAEAYARGGRVAAQKYGAAVPQQGRGRQSAALPEIKTRAVARPARMSAPPAPREEAALDPRRVFPVSRRAGSAEGDAVAVRDDGEVEGLRRGGRVRR